MVEKILKGNQAFRETEVARDPGFYAELAKGQSPTVLWIGCSDSRVPPELATNSRPGELFVHRNIGNVVPNYDWNFATVLEYAINHLKVKEIVICGHSDCGACKALDADLKNDHYIPFWLTNAMPAKQHVDSQQPAPTDDAGKAARLEAIVKENVRLQLRHLAQYPLVQAALADGRVRLHGLYHDIGTGEMTPID
ncbi:MAG TPA: carbonic anhydrase [Methanoregulaceae archaeon]|nr:carbonic anhydrase [Methanoregulaceae archaeon]HOV67338.1 carbonic anhydrase [Methanoregulaceae archaeon]HQJ87878.1 carbonic anhydrase [Methanoregulaceae archaeon]